MIDDRTPIADHPEAGVDQAVPLPGQQQPIVVIGYGNLLRGDDGVGQWVAQMIAAWRLPDVAVYAVQQLTPELALPLATAQLAIFVDAHLDPAGQAGLASESIAVQPVTPVSVATSLGHTSAPGTLLALVERVWGSYPRSWWITVPVASFAYGAPLSPIAWYGTSAALLQTALLIALARREC
jgi:hydrogenase maturation protease